MQIQFLHEYINECTEILKINEQMKRHENIKGIHRIFHYKLNQ